jgi:hypothetical protein
MAIDLDEMIERAFARALNRVIRARAEAIFADAFENGAPIGRTMTKTIESDLKRFIAETMELGIC